MDIKFQVNKILSTNGGVDDWLDLISQLKSIRTDRDLLLQIYTVAIKNIKKIPSVGYKKLMIGLANLQSEFSLNLARETYLDAKALDLDCAIVCVFYAQFEYLNQNKDKSRQVIQAAKKNGCIPKQILKRAYQNWRHNKLSLFDGIPDPWNICDDDTGTGNSNFSKSTTENRSSQLFNFIPAKNTTEEKPKMLPPPVRIVKKSNSTSSLLSKSKYQTPVNTIKLSVKNDKESTDKKPSERHGPGMSPFMKSKYSPLLKRKFDFEIESISDDNIFPSVFSAEKCLFETPKNRSRSSSEFEKDAYGSSDSCTSGMFTSNILKEANSDLKQRILKKSLSSPCVFESNKYPSKVNLEKHLESVSEGNSHRYDIKNENILLTDIYSSTSTNNIEDIETKSSLLLSKHQTISSDFLTTNDNSVNESIANPLSSTVISKYPLGSEEQCLSSNSKEINNMCSSLDAKLDLDNHSFSKISESLVSKYGEHQVLIPTDKKISKDKYTVLPGCPILENENDFKNPIGFDKEKTQSKCNDSVNASQSMSSSFSHTLSNQNNETIEKSLSQISISNKETFKTSSNMINDSTLPTKQVNGKIEKSSVSGSFQESKIQGSNGDDFFTGSALHYSHGKVSPTSYTVKGVRYHRKRVLGKGGSCKVYEIVSDYGEIFALKKVNLYDADDFVLNMYKNEIKFLEAMKGNKYIIRLYEWEIKDENLFIVLEKGDMDLAHALKSKNILSREEMKKYWKQIIIAVKVIHENGIIHTDLKPANFLLVGGILKLIDFGIANSIQDNKTSVTRECQMGTLNYMSPEVLVQDGCRVSRASDVWSLGCMLYYMIYKRTPYSNIKNQYLRFYALQQGKTIDFTGIEDKQLLDCLQGCLKHDRKERYSLQQLLEHSYLN